MLEARNISYTYPHANEPVFEGLSIAIAPGELVALVGANGSGKSTVARVLAGSFEPSSGCVLLDGKPVRESWSNVGLVRQDPQAQLVNESVFDEVAFGPHNAGMPKDDIRLRVDAALGSCGISHLVAAQTSELSGGEQQRLAVAGIVAMDPQYLVLDEPTAYLDPAARESFLRLLLSLVKEGKGIVLCTHRQDEIDAATRIVHMGSANEAPNVESGNTNPSVPSDLLFATPGKDLLLQDVTVVRNKNVALSQATVSARPGNITLVVGGSGAGKTTAALALAGVLQPNRGTAWLGNAPIRMGDVGLCMQRSEDQLFCDTVIEDVLFGLRNAGLSSKEAQMRAERALSLLRVPRHLWSMHSSKLSGGERRRVAVAAIVAMDYAAYVFDEPTAGMDSVGCAYARELVCTLARAGKTVVVITHDVDAWVEVAQHAVLLSNGKVTTAGDVRAVVEAMQTYAPEAPIWRPPHTTWLHHTPAGIKIAALLAVTVVMFAFPSVELAAVFALLACALLPFTGASIASALSILRNMAVVLLFAVVATVFRFDGSGSIPLFATVGLSQDGFAHAALAVLRIVGLSLLVTCVASTTAATTAAEALMVPLRPLDHFGAHIDTLTTVVALSLRSLGYAFELFRRIEVAQRVRRAPLGQGGLRKSLASWEAVLVPMIVALLKHADELADALADRGYGRD